MEDEDGLVEVLNEGIYVYVGCFEGSGGFYILVFIGFY